MADPFSTLPPEVALEQAQISRQQQLANLLMQQGMQQPQGQMVSGRYVPPSIFQNLAGLANIYVGQKKLEESDKQRAELAQKLREGESKTVKEYFKALQGTPETRTEMAGPFTGDIPAPVLTQAGSGPNYQQAFEIATNPYAPSWLKQQAVEQMKPQKLGEGEVLTRINPFSGKQETIAKGAEKYRAPTSVDMGTMGTMLIYPDGRREVIQKGVQGPAGQVVEREDGTFLIDTRTGVAKPILGPQGQPLTGGKPLTETQSNAVAFGARAMEADRLATNLEDKGVTNIGAIRSFVGGVVGTAPFVGEKLEQTAISAFNPLPQALGGPSPEQQQNAQARRNFISAVLRKESGAAISPKEYADEERKYFPEIGDSPAVIKQKQDARKLAIKALEAQAGPSGKRQIEKIGQQTKLSPQDQEALNWANANPDDPRAAQIKQRLER